MRIIGGYSPDIKFKNNFQDSPTAPPSTTTKTTTALATTTTLSEYANCDFIYEALRRVKPA